MALANVLMAVENLMDSEGITFRLGSENIASNGSPPQIVWVPMSERFEGPSKHRAQRHHLTQVRTRISTLEAHIWAKGEDGPTSHLAAVEVLLDKVVGAFYGVAPGAFQATSVLHLGVDGGNTLFKGRACVLTLELMFPVLEYVPDGTITSVAVSRLERQGTADFPGEDNDEVVDEGFDPPDPEEEEEEEDP